MQDVPKRHACGAAAVAATEDAANTLEGGLMIGVQIWCAFMLALVTMAVTQRLIALVFPKVNSMTWPVLTLWASIGVGAFAGWQLGGVLPL